ncbi:NUDIX hydrolase [Dactylosporangium matsuzakiense]|uniref:NUDIX hydrolase n=1 Tax=Dactylosporangium matsuzakiense TaxID=53360 RepID=UPI0021C3CCDB|nr:NUDIX hydrolase [Dactylosporangium matsuzakiense]UWZ43312.1 NUDIX hydrolase [Dactylosporangium matsuzakiense]
MSSSALSNGSQVTSAVAAIIEDAAGRVLLCRQAGGHRLWGLPGGRVRAAESPVHAVIRDIREETGLETEILELIGLYQLTGDGCGASTPDLFVHVFRGRIDGDGGPALNAPGRISGLGWHDTDCLPEPMTATTRTAIADATARRTGVIREVQRDAEPEVIDA